MINGQPFADANSTATLSGVGIGFAATQRVPFEPRSSLKLGTTIRSDARLTKTFPYAEGAEHYPERGGL